MRRANSASVKVIAPSRGVVTRWPGDTADMLASGVEKFSMPGMKNRASTFGSNVRYEDGVVKNSPGYTRVQGADSLVAHWPLDEASGTRFDTSPNQLNLTEHPFVDQTTGQISFAAHFPKSLIFDDFESYTDGVSVNGLNLGIGWTGAYTDRSLFIVDTFESYTDGASVDGLNSGVNWAGAFTDR